MKQSVSIDLPERVTRKFEAQLRHLVDHLARENGYKGLYLREEIFSKYLDESLVPAATRRRAAIRKWISAERHNVRTNQRLLWGSPQWSWCGYDEFLTDCRKIIADILGPVVYPDVLSGASWTNGASTRVRRSPAASCVKLTGEIDITSSAVKHWFAWASGTLMSDQPLQIRESSELFTVPKKTEIDRCCCKEPEGNALLQRSVGLYLRKRLRRVGINLQDQTRNQRLAEEGSRSRGFATLDLSSASDTVSEQIVTLLLPPEWCWLLDDLRAKSVRIRGVEHTFAMFSSMGNGFTFELETLLFYAIARATQRASGIEGQIAVYGDDIIVPAKLARRVVRVLEWFGFKPNRKKTHITGSFRESCGGHYWRGFDVKPFYVRGAVRTLPDLINILNSLLEWDCRGWGFFTTEEAYQFWNAWRHHVPRFLWGGVDPSDPSCLVTGDLPRKRLIPETKAVKVTEESRLRNWLLQAGRTRGPIQPILVRIDCMTGVTTEHHWMSYGMPEIRRRITVAELAPKDEPRDPLVVDPRIETRFIAEDVARGVLPSYQPGICWAGLTPTHAIYGCQRHKSHPTRVRLGAPVRKDR